MEERKIKINDLEVNFKIGGEGMPLLILHGWGGSSDSWLKVQEILSLRGVEVICPDLPGFGKSQMPIAIWGTENYADFILNFAKAVGLERFFLLGHSFGGGVAARFAAQFPEKIESLILCGSAIVRKRKLTFRQKSARFLAKIGRVFAKLSFAKRLIYRIAGSRDYFEAQGIMKEVFKKITAEDLTSFSASIKTPTLIIWGQNDKVLPVNDAFLLNKMIPDSEIEIIPGAKHGPQFTHPERLSEIILNFINPVRD